MPAFLPSELPIVDRVRHHWIVLFRPPGWVLGTALLVLVIAAIVEPWPMAVLLALILGLTGFFRWQTWHAESIILTKQRIVRVSGVPETTSSEASLRLDRVSGAVLEQTVMGKLLDYANVQLEAPGSHPSVRELMCIASPNRFYLNLRQIVFSPGLPMDPNDSNEKPEDYITEPLPTLGQRPMRHHD